MRVSPEAWEKQAGRGCLSASDVGKKKWGKKRLILKKRPDLLLWEKWGVTHFEIFTQRSRPLHGSNPGLVVLEP
jgi:hypothetical protein